MKKTNKLASIVLFLAALVVAFDARPGWSQWTPPLNGPYAQCKIDTGSQNAGGLVVLPDGRVLVSTFTQGLSYFSSLPSDPTQCPNGPPTSLNSSSYISLTIGLDGKVYALKGGFPPPFPTHIDLVTVNGYSGGEAPVGNLQSIDGLGMTLDPITGDLYMTKWATSDTIFKITGLYSGTPAISVFEQVDGASFDGLAWSCDGKFLFVASPGTNTLYRFDRLKNSISANVPGGPDGVAVGAVGTPEAGFVFTSDNDGTVTKIRNLPNGFGQQFVIASGGQRGDWIFVDAQGAMDVIQGDHLQRLSSTNGGQWVRPGATLCSDLGCGAESVTTPQVDRERCFSFDEMLDVNLILTLSQSACGTCESCAVLNQARSTLSALLNSLDPPKICLNSLKLTIQSLSESCPCSSDPRCNVVVLPPPCSTCTPNAKLPFNFDLASYDPVLQAFMK